MLYGVPALRRTGRYPWGVGFYDMKGPLMVPLDTIMLPRIMRDMGYRTHAIGKFVRPACYALSQHWRATVSQNFIAGGI